MRRLQADPRRQFTQMSECPFPRVASQRRPSPPPPKHTHTVPRSCALSNDLPGKKRIESFVLVEEAETIW